MYGCGDSSPNGFGGLGSVGQPLIHSHRSRPRAATPLAVLAGDHKDPQLRYPKQKMQRTLEVQKEIGSRLLLGLSQRGAKQVSIASVAFASPIAGQVFPGDLILEVNGIAASNARHVAKQLTAACSLTLLLETPLEADLLRIRTPALQLIADPRTGLAQVCSASAVHHTSTREMAGADLALGVLDLELASDLEPAPGDLIVAVGVDGVSYYVGGPSEAMARLEEASSQATTEVLVVRAPADANKPISSTRRLRDIAGAKGPTSPTESGRSTPDSASSPASGATAFLSLSPQAMSLPPAIARVAWHR